MKNLLKLAFFVIVILMFCWAASSALGGTTVVVFDPFMRTFCEFDVREEPAPLYCVPHVFVPVVHIERGICDAAVWPCW